MRRSRWYIPLFLGATVFSLAAVPDTAHKSVVALSEKAAEGDAEALYQLARLHDIGYDTIPVDSARSTALYLQAAAMGNAKAMNYLGFRYFKGEYVAEDIDSALYWLGKAVEAGDPGAANNLGYLYASGMNVEQDYVKAREWFGKAAEAGIHSAESQLADLYCEGLGGETDTVAALDLYSRASKAGILDAGIKRAELLKTLAAKGDARAMALLGDAYSRGEGVAYNHQLATEYFLRAALAGDADAALVIAELLEIFPETLKTESLIEIMQKFLQMEKIPEEMLSASFWYDKYLNHEKEMNNSFK